MARIPEFRAKAPKRQLISGYAQTGDIEAMQGVANNLLRLTGRLSNLADKAAAREGSTAGLEAAQQVEMPTFEYAVEDGAPAKFNFSPELNRAIAEASQRHGEDPTLLGLLAQLESGGKISAQNPKSSAGGPFQFLDDTAKQYGLANRFDPFQAADAVARLTKDNRKALTRALGRAPTTAELYLAHQQGAGGASQLLKNRDRLATDFRSNDEISLNGGRTDMTAGQFADLWLSRANKALASAGGGQKIVVSQEGEYGALQGAQGGTIRGDAYNQAAMGTYVNRLGAQMRSSMNARSLEFGDDPTELATAVRADFAEIKKLIAENNALDRDTRAQLLGVAEGQYMRLEGPLLDQAARRAQARIERDFKASMHEALEAHETTIARMLDGGADLSDENVQTEIAHAHEMIDGGPFTAGEKHGLRKALQRSFASRHVLSELNRIDDPAKRQAYVHQFQQDFAAGEGPAGKLDVESYDQINNKLVRALQADEAALRKRSKAFDSAVDQQISALKKGVPIPVEAMNGLQEAAAQTGDATLQARVNLLSRMSDWHQTNVKARPVAVDAQIDVLQKIIHAKGATPASLQMLDVMRGLRRHMGDQIETNPLGWAHKIGLQDVEKIDFKDLENLEANLSERASDALTVAEYYGQDPVFFQPEERQLLISMLDESPHGIVAVTHQLSMAFGENTPSALAELSKEAPILAHIGGLTDATASTQIAAEVADMLTLRRQDGYQSTAPSAKEMTLAGLPLLNGALDRMPNLQHAVMQTASILVEKRARMAGVDVSDLQDGEAHSLVEDAINDALGRRKVGGKQYGGIVEINGAGIVVPSDVRADYVEPLLRDITAETLSAQEPIGSVNSIPLKPHQIRDGQFISAGDGLYHVALNGLNSPDPEYVMTPDGEYWVFDLRRHIEHQLDAVGEITRKYVGDVIIFDGVPQ